MSLGIVGGPVHSEGEITDPNELRKGAACGLAMVGLGCIGIVVICGTRHSGGTIVT